MIATLYEPARLINTTWFAKFHQVLSLIECYLLLKLITAKALDIRRTLDGQISAVATDAYPDGTTVTTADITLLNAAATESLPLVIIVTDKELTFYLQSTH